MPFTRRRHLLEAIAASAGLACLGLAPLTTLAAEPWPQKPIHIVVPYAPGGSSDTLGRLIGKHLSEVFKQPVLIDNRGGAAGMIGSQAVAHSPPDGYTLVVSGIGSHVIAPVESRKTFDPMKDFTHIAMLGGPPLALVVNSREPVQSFKDFAKYVSSNPNGLSWASPGQGTHGGLTGELFRNATKLSMTQIGYKGASAAITDLLGGTVAAGFMTLSSANEHIKSGRLRLLALSSEKRLAAYPDVPTFAEMGYPQLTGTTWFALAGPAGMPREIVDKINAEVRRGMQTPALKAQLASESMETFDYDAATMTRFVAAEIAKWSPLALSAASAASR